MNTLTLFERNLEIATAELVKLQGKSVKILDIINIFFDGITKEPIMLEDFTQIEGEKNAIVLLGQSCTGKSTYAKEFIRKHPEFEYISMDECAFREYKKLGQVYIDIDDFMNSNLGNREMGVAIEKGNNIILDACWLHINSRSALLKTLRQFGYKTYAFYFWPTEEIHNQMIISRNIQQTARCILNGEFNFEKVDWVSKYQEIFHYSREEAINSIQSSDLFKEKLNNERNLIYNEYISSGFENQIRDRYFFASFDYVYIIEV